MPRRRSQNFLPPDVHDGPMPMDFFVWLIRSATRSVLVDTGFSAATGVARERNFLRCPIEALAALGTAPEQVHEVVLTHLHYDHAGNLGLLPNARFHVQELEMQFATGRCMCEPAQRHAYAVDDVTELVRQVYADRVVFHRGDSELAPGVQLLLIGGHTQGLQAVRVRTARGWVVLASDASHYYENVERTLAFPIVFNRDDMLAGHRRITAAADSPQHVVPGHDPLVMQRYPRVPGDEAGIVCLHRAPSA
ncbi:N-acyl homoserine lactonase family protein [Sphaerotilaceae bacterium SBD11-9]